MENPLLEPKNNEVKNNKFNNINSTVKNYVNGNLTNEKKNYNISKKKPKNK